MPSDSVPDDVRRLLDERAAAREERDVQAKKQRQNRVEPPPGGKDW